MTKSTGVGRGGARDGSGRPPNPTLESVAPKVQAIVDTENMRRLLERAEVKGAATMPKSVADMTSKDVLRYCYTYHMTRAAAYQQELKTLGPSAPTSAINALLGRIDAYLLAARDAASLAAPYEHHRLSAIKMTAPPQSVDDMDLSTWSQEDLEKLAGLMEKAGAAVPGGGTPGATTPRH